MGTVINAINKRIAAHGDLNKIASARTVLADEKSKIEKAAQCIPAIQEYLEKQGTGLDSLYRAIGSVGERAVPLAAAHPRLANAAAMGTAGAVAGGAEQGLQEDGSVAKGMLGGAVAGAAGLEAAQGAARLLGKSKRIAEALRHTGAIKKFGPEAGEEFMSRMQMAPGQFKQQARAAGADVPAGLGERALAGLGRGAEAVEGFNPGAALASGARDIKARPQVQSMLADKKTERTVRSGARKANKAEAEVTGHEESQREAART